MNYKLGKSGLTAKRNIEKSICYCDSQIWLTMIFSYHHYCICGIKKYVFFSEKTLTYGQIGLRVVCVMVLIVVITTPVAIYYLRRDNAKKND